MIAAAPVMIPAARPTPWATASRVSSVSSWRSSMRLSRKTWWSIERPNSSEKRSSGTHASIAPAAAPRSRRRPAAQTRRPARASGASPKERQGAVERES